MSMNIEYSLVVNCYAFKHPIQGLPIQQHKMCLSLKSEATAETANYTSSTLRKRPDRVNLCLMHLATRQFVAATCYEQPVLGGHLSSPWLLGFLQCKLWSCLILLARCWTALLAPTALASSTSPTQQNTKNVCFLYQLPRKCLAMSIPINVHMLEVHMLHAAYLHPFESFSQITTTITCKSDGDFL